MRTLAAAPGDARAMSALGAVLERQGDRAGAYDLYEQARAISATEIHAILRLLDRSLVAGEHGQVLDLIDVALRRWPSYWPQLAEVLSYLAARPDAAEELSRRLADRPPWRSSALRHLLQSDAGLAMVSGLLAGELADGVALEAGDVNATIAALVARGSVASAYQLFMASLNADEQAVTGYVFDPAFTQPAGRHYFGWSFRQGTGAEMRFGGADPARTGGLVVRFLDSPARLGGVTQVLRLPTGRYQLSMQADASQLQAPRGLYWRLVCVSGRRGELVRLEAEPGSYTERTSEISFDVPAADCALQRLSLETGVETDSWRDRYSGSFTVRSVSVTRL
ncbi:MAG: tetratricopeptide repeat protein [Devosia sp.]